MEFENIGEGNKRFPSNDAYYYVQADIHIYAMSCKVNNKTNWKGK